MELKLVVVNKKLKRLSVPFILFSRKSLSRKPLFAENLKRLDLVLQLAEFNLLGPQMLGCAQQSQR